MDSVFGHFVIMRLAFFVAESDDTVELRLQESSWNVAKGAAAAAALALVLSASPVQANEGKGAFLAFPDNAAGEASRNILSDAKKKADDSFAEAQKTGLETTGQAASAGQAPPAISQVDPNAEEASDSVGDAIATRADVSLHLPPTFPPQSPIVMHHTLYIHLLFDIIMIISTLSETRNQSIFSLLLLLYK